MIRAFDLVQHCFSYLKKFGNIQNTKKLGEIVSLLTIYGDEILDFQGLQLAYAALPVLNLSSRVVKNLTIRGSEINLVILDNTPIKVEDGLRVEDCILCLVGGVSTQMGLPTWIYNAEVIAFDRISNASRIKESVLNPPQKLFLSIVHKIFFQPGSGREESSLLKGGYGQKFSPKLADSIIKILLREGLIERMKGDDGWVYKPVRRFTDRLNKIRSELTLSDDPLWQEMTSMRH
jgi:hypothetical protein